MLLPVLDGDASFHGCQELIGFRQCLDRTVVKFGLNKSYVLIIRQKVTEGANELEEVGFRMMFIAITFYQDNPWQTELTT